MKLQFEQQENDKERQKDITVAEIRAAGYGAMQDINENKQSDYMDSLEKIQKSEQYQDQMNMKRDQFAIKSSLDKDKMQIEREKILAQRDIANKNLEIARENKNKYDVPKDKTDKKK